MSVSSILAEFDEAIATKCHDLMDQPSKWRSFFKSFEYLFHGVPWFFLVGIMYFLGDKYVSSIAVLLFQGTHASKI